jgi:hypothetical protein
VSEQVTDKKLTQEQKKDDLSIEFATPVVHEKTIDINLPKIERRISSEPEQKVDINEVTLATPKLAVDTFMKPAVSRLEEKDLELITKQSVKQPAVTNNISIGTSVKNEIATEKSEQKIEQSKPSLEKEFFSLKSKGYVDTILDKLMNFIANLLKKLDYLIFRGSSKFSSKKALKAKRAAELEEFMNERYKELQNKKAMLTSRGEKSKSTEQAKNAEEGFSINQKWDDE